MEIMTIFAAFPVLRNTICVFRVKRESGEKPEQTPLLYVLPKSPIISATASYAGRLRRRDEPEDLPDNIFVEAFG